jgi:acylphosphatase
MKRCVRCYVSGDVQGVAYRAATRQKARTLGVSGYARNLADGRVEVLACGDEEAVAALQEWLWQGPPWAQVTDIYSEAVDCQEPVGFTVA